MTNLAIELLLLIIVLVNFGTILTAKIYSQSVKEIQRKRLFVVNLYWTHIMFFNKLIPN